MVRDLALDVALGQVGGFEVRTNVSLGHLGLAVRIRTSLASSSPSSTS